MYLFKNKSYLSKCHTIKNKTSTIINHQISPTKKITPVQFPSISEDSPVFPTEKTRHPLCFPHFFRVLVGWFRGAAAPLRASDPIEAHQSSVTSQVVPVAKSRSNKPSAPDDGFGGFHRAVAFVESACGWWLVGG